MREVPAAPLVRQLFRWLGPNGRCLRVVLEEARRRAVRAYLGGGPVRDLLLGLPVRDIDILLSDRLEEIAEASAERVSGRVRRHERFLTATLEGADLRIDLSRARKEVYPSPGALPRVRPAELEEDFARRDFSVNAMALPLDARSKDSVLDPQGGMADLEARRLRVLHPESFVDDPTRLYRAARYAGRLGFRLEPDTARLAREAVRAGTVDTLSPARIRHEIERMLDEGKIAPIAVRTEQLGLLGAAARGWRLTAECGRGLRRLDRSRARPPWPEMAGALVLRGCGVRLLLLGLGKPLRTRALERLGIGGGAAERIERDLEPFRDRVRGLARPLSPGALDARLSAVSEAGLLFLFCGAPAAAQRRVARYARSLRHTLSSLDGYQALALGAQGPQVGALLRAARRRALDGLVVDEPWARRWLARHRQIE